jgi:hypothetical protein
MGSFKKYTITGTGAICAPEAITTTGIAAICVGAAVAATAGMTDVRAGMEEAAITGATPEAITEAAITENADARLCLRPPGRLPRRVAREFAPSDSMGEDGLEVVNDEFQIVPDGSHSLGVHEWRVFDIINLPEFKNIWPNPACFAPCF